MSRTPTPVLFAGLAAAALLAAGPAAANGDLPRPPGLENAVQFWIRVYSEVDRQGGLIHDSEHLDVVYEVVRFPEGLSQRGRERRVEKRKREFKNALRSLAKGKRSGLTSTEKHVLSRWPDGTSNSTFSRAARRLRFQLGQADKFRAGLVRAGRWRDYINRVLIEHDVPVELAALPHVESSYNPRAYSRVGAAGMWQFTRSTGRRYLRIDGVVDDRLDPYRATVAAARLLRDNHASTKTWPLAITAYNHGAAGMRRAARRLGTRDIATIVKRYKSRTFGFASRNFYASFLAASAVDRDVQRYFGTLRIEEPIPYAMIELDHYYPAGSFASALGVDPTVIREHNLALRPSVWNGSKYLPKGYTLRIPKSALSQDPQLAMASIAAGDRKARQTRDRFHKVRRGETLSRIARRYGVSERELVAVNNLRSRHRIRSGQVLVLPDRASGGPAPVAIAKADPPADGIHRVKRGEALWKIARRYGVSESALVRANGLRNKTRLQVGQRLRIPGAGGAVTVAKADPPAPKPAAVAPKPASKTVAKPTPPAPKPEPAPAVEPEPTVVAAVVEPAPVAEPAVEDAAPVATAEVVPAVATTESASGTASPDPSNYAVGPGNRIVVQAAETLGHYAEWLDVRASDLRRLNGLRYGTPVVIGRRLKLDLSRVGAEAFEARRLAYHRSIQEEFFGAYNVTGTESHTLRKGDTLWYLAQRKYRVPVWLLRQYNPDLDFGALPAGASMVIPQIEARSS